MRIIYNLFSSSRPNPRVVQATPSLAVKQPSPPVVSVVVTHKVVAPPPPVNVVDTSMWDVTKNVFRAPEETEVVKLWEPRPIKPVLFPPDVTKLWFFDLLPDQIVAIHGAARNF